MSPAESRIEGLISFFVPVMIVLLGCGASLLPWKARIEIFDCLLAWTCLSVPLAILIGHCTLSED